MMFTVKIAFKVITSISAVKKTTVTLNGETKDKLAKFGTKGESFNEILERVMANTATLCNNKPEEEDDVATTEESE